MKTTKIITLTALWTALLICVQLALSGVAGVELVTVFFAAFCYFTGIAAGLTVAVCFSMLRCFLFGFYPTVIILYLVYYCIFAVVFGAIGKKTKGKISVGALIVATVVATALTAVFTLLDDVITPLFFGFGLPATRAYFYASLPFMSAQCICAAISVSVLFLPIVKTLSVAVGKRA